MPTIDTSALMSTLHYWGPTILAGIFSFAGGYFAARKAAKTQILTTAQTSFVSSKLNAFLDFESAYEQWCVEPSRPACSKMYRCGNAVYLVANDETRKLVGQILDLIRRYEKTGEKPDYEEFVVPHAMLSEAMRRDLLTFPVPRPLKKHRSFH